MADWFEWDSEWNTLTLTSIKPGVRFEYEEARRDHMETDAYLTRIWYE